MAASRVKETMRKVVTDVESSDIGGAVKVELKGPYWLTRDRTAGQLSNVVEVWLVKPDLQRFDDGDVMWLPSLEHIDNEDTHFAEWSLDKCRKEAYTVPETERECIKVG